MERLYNIVKKSFDKKEFSKSSEEVLDPVYEFFKIAYHLREWVEKDDKISQVIKDKMPTFEKYDSRVGLKICRDLCNKSKHGELKNRFRPNDVNTKIKEVGGTVFSIHKDKLRNVRNNNKTIHLKKEDGIFMGNFIVEFAGKQYTLEGVVEECMFEWKKFFKDNSILMPRMS